MKQSKEPSLFVKTVRCSVSENNCRHPFWPRFNVSINCTLCIHVPERNRLFVELGHMLEYHLATAYWMASHSIVHSGPLHTYPDIFESATISFRVQKYPRPHVSIFKWNLPVHSRGKRSLSSAASQPEDYFFFAKNFVLLQFCYGIQRPP